MPTYFHTFVERLSRIDLKCVVVFWEWLITCSLHAALGRSSRISPNHVFVSGRRCIRSPQLGLLASPRHGTGGRRRVRRDSHALTFVGRGVSPIGCSQAWWEAGVRRQAGRVIRESSASTEVAGLAIQGFIRRWWAFSRHMESVHIEGGRSSSAS